MLESVCCFIEVIGFELENGYFIREFAALNSNSTLHGTVNHGLTKTDIPEGDLWGVGIEENAVYGLDFSGSEADIKIDDLKAIIKQFYEAAKTPDKFLVGYASKATNNFLRELQIPRMEVDEGKAGPPCHLHSNNPNFICALSRVIAMYNKHRNPFI
uniref:Uncharacterized protein n=1 Tax=Tetranychus urticae TaxID=32264 RepID=T1KF51_TETUR